MPAPPILVSPNGAKNISLNDSAKVAAVLAGWFVDALQFMVDPIPAAVPGSPVFLKNGVGLVDANKPESRTLHPVLTDELAGMGVTPDEAIYMLMTYKAPTLAGTVNTTVEVAEVRRLLGVGTLDDLVNLYGFLLGNNLSLNNTITALDRDKVIAAQVKSRLTLP